MVSVPAVVVVLSSGSASHATGIEVVGAVVSVVVVEFVEQGGSAAD